MWVISGISDAKSQNVSCADAACGIAKSGFERALVVADRHALVGRDRPSCRVHADAIERTDGWILPGSGAAAGLPGCVPFADGARTSDRIRGFDRRALRRRKRRSGI